MDVRRRIPEKWYLEYSPLLEVMQRLDMLGEQGRWPYMRAIRKITAVF